MQQPDMYFVCIIPLSTNMGYIHRSQRALAQRPPGIYQIKVPWEPSPRPDLVMLFTSLIELAFTFAKSYSQFMIKIHSGRPHGVKFAGIFGNNAWPQLISSWLDHQPTRYLLFTPDWFGKVPPSPAIHLFSLAPACWPHSWGHNARWIATITRPMVCENLPISNCWESSIAGPSGRKQDEPARKAVTRLLIRADITKNTTPCQL